MEKAASTATLGTATLTPRSALRTVLGVIVGVLICPALTYAPLSASHWLRAHVAPKYSIPALLVWIVLVQALSPILLWKRSRPIAIGFLAYIGFEVVLIVAMFAGIVPPV